MNHAKFLGRVQVWSVDFWAIDINDMKDHPTRGQIFPDSQSQVIWALNISSQY